MQVIVCDDDPDVGALIMTLLAVEGWSAQLVTSGKELLEIAPSGDVPPDAVILDQIMPGLTGIETAALLRDQGFRQPIILCSGHLAPELAADIERLELIPCNKIDMSALVRIVRAAVREARLLRRRRAEHRA